MAQAHDYDEAMRAAARKRDIRLEDIHQRNRDLQRRHEALEDEAYLLNRLESRVHETIEELGHLADDEEWRRQGHSIAQEFYYARQEAQRAISEEYETLEEEKHSISREENACLHAYERTRAEVQMKRDSGRRRGPL